jgi:hypothetical protein
MYLVATSRGLGQCALGAGDSDGFSELVGEDYYRETAVGEFMLGRPSNGEAGLDRILSNGGSRNHEKAKET